MTEFKRVFVDTAPIIYYLENSALYVDSIKNFFTKCIEENIQIVTSAITIEVTVNFETMAWSAAEIMQQSCLYLEISIPTK